MATKNDRVSQFNQGAPPVGEPLQLLCEDHNGTYQLPFYCQWKNGEWRSCNTGEVLAFKVAGWRQVNPY